MSKHLTQPGDLQQTHADTMLTLDALDLKRKKKIRQTWCVNCGKSSHSSKTCLAPVISCGMILIQRQITKADTIETKMFNSVDQRNHDMFNLQLAPVLLPAPQQSQVRYLLIRRKDSLSAVEFIRGKYDPCDIRFLFQMFTEMAQCERERLRKLPFHTLWTTLWSCSSTCGHDYEMARVKFETIRAGYRTPDGRLVSIEQLIRDTYCPYLEPEWGFPKGKRNRRENDLECAQRECCEEVGCSTDDFAVLHQLGCAAEEFRGSNGVLYRHNYFVGKYLSSKAIRLDKSNNHQMSEVGDIGWFSLKDALNKFRPYDVEKKVMLAKLDNILSNHSFGEETIVIV